MAGLINFESSREIDRKRDEIRVGRQKILEKAKEKYEKEERRKELAKQRGEDTWMLSSINERVTNEEQSMKKAKSKKKKKEKKKKKRKDSSSSSDSSDEEEDQPQWIEKSATVKKPEVSAPVIKGPQMQRDDWMNAPLDIFPTVSRKDLIDKKNKEKEEIARQKEMMEKPGMHAKELNPYWKDGGTGLPEEKPATSQRAAPVATGSGDSGLSWLQRSYKRCVEQAKEEQRTLEEVAAERYGSLEKLQGMIRDAEAAAGKGQGRSDRGGASGDRRGGMRKGFMRPTDSYSSDYKQSNKPRSRSRSRSPSGHSRGYRNRSRERDRRRSRSRERYKRSRSRSRSPRRDRSRSRSRERRRERSRSRERYRQKSRSPGRKTGSSSLRGRFMKPGDMDDSSRKIGRSGPDSSGQPAWRKKEFQKPVEVEETRKESERESSEKKSRDREEKSRRRRSPSESSSLESSSSEDSDSSSSDEGQGQGQKSAPREPEVRILTEKEMNDLGAKILKAEIMGNKAQAEKLKAQLEAAQEAKKNAPAGGGNEMKRRGTEEEEDFVVLTRTDRSGLARPVPESEYPSESGGKRRRKKHRVETHTGKQGERTKYFDDDDKFDLKTLVEREKLGTAEDQNQMFARLAGRAAEKTDDDFQVDDMFVNKASHKQSESIQEQRDRAQAVFEHKKMASALEKCSYCFNKVPKHLIVAIGTKAYLCLPNYKSLTEGHCLIVPMQHVAASTALDEDVWSEMQVFRKCLTKMFTEHDEDVVFMETIMRLKHFPHMYIECVPMDKEVGDLAPIYFKKAIQESESEWSQNKKVVDLSQKDIRHAVPKGFPYFAVDFGYQGGFAHVIEDEQKFPNYFGKEIIGGMIDAEHRLWRKPMKENFDDQRRKVMKFAEMWKPYDWTQNIAKKMESSSSDSDSD